MTEALGNPILNSPYEPPQVHFELGPHGPTGRVSAGRRPSESFIPIAPTRKGRVLDSGALQAEIDFDVTGERRERNSLINDLRRDVERWRLRDYDRVTPTTRKLLQHWADPSRGDDRVFFCQREAAETAIFLAEVSGRAGYTDWRIRLTDANAVHNADLPRIALKMATGAGKTVVMAMLIAWQTLNKAQSPRDARFTSRFLVVTPGITIRDRLRVLQPGDPQNYYDLRGLIPPDLKGALAQAQVAITNYHAFLPRDAKEIRGVATTTRKILRAGRVDDPFEETPAAMVSRVLRDLNLNAGGSVKAGGGIVVFNDEAHHCYQDRPLAAAPEVGASALSKEEREANAEARVWFRGVQALAKHGGVKAVYDLSATPFYLAGSGYSEGYIFPWTVSDFSLMDAIDSGIVKIPRTPVDDDAEGDLVTYLRLWDHIGDKLPKKKAPGTAGNNGWVPPPELEGALHSLYRSYERAFRSWQQIEGAPTETPPVFIIVCPNTVVSRLVYDWIAGTVTEADDGTPIRWPGRLELFSNVEDGQVLARPRTILVDSVALERGDKLSPEFKQAAEVEIAAFQAEYRRRNPGADAAALTDEDLLREVMNTVGKQGMLGEQVRCVVSVAMLTEGWDANTVTHILGLRAFRSQLLCEQVVGRGLRRRSYAVNDEGRFEPEYANVYGIPFAFIPTDRPVAEVPPRSPAVEVGSVAGREHLRITFPHLDGYRVEVPDEDLVFAPDSADVFEVRAGTVPTWVESAGIVGESEEIRDRDPASYRTQEVAFVLARRLLDSHFTDDADGRRPWLFPRLVRICRDWLDQCVHVADGASLGQLMYAEAQAEAAEAVNRAILRNVGGRRERLRPMLRRFEPVGSTGDVYFLTRKGTMPAEKSEVSHVTFDGVGGNTWEQILGLECELHPDVAAYVKNDHLGFTIPYVHQGRTHSYVPDFLVRLQRQDGADFDRTLIVEVSGGQKSPGPTKVKALTARDTWCVAVNNSGAFGRWGYIEITSMLGVRETLAGAIAALYADAPIIGDPDLLDFAESAQPA